MRRWRDNTDARVGERSPRKEWEWEPRALRRRRDRTKHSRRRRRFSGRSPPPPRHPPSGGAPFRLCSSVHGGRPWTEEACDSRHRKDLVDEERELPAG
jgi:hypothetical protein